MDLLLKLERVNSLHSGALNFRTDVLVNLLNIIEIPSCGLLTEDP